VIYPYANIAGNHNSGSINSSIRNFSIIKTFSVDCHPKKATHVIQVNCEPPECGWFNCNTDVAAVNDGFSRAACGGIFLSCYNVFCFLYLSWLAHDF